MENRTLAVAALLVVLALAVSSGGQQVVDAQAQPAPKQIEQNSFIQVGNYMLNKNKICYVRKLDEGVLDVHFAGQNVSVTLSGEAAKAFLRDINRNGR